MSGRLGVWAVGSAWADWAARPLGQIRPVLAPRPFGLIRLIGSRLPLVLRNLRSMVSHVNPVRYFDVAVLSILSGFALLSSLLSVLVLLIDGEIPGFIYIGFELKLTRAALGGKPCFSSSMFFFFPFVYLVFLLRLVLILF